jgi:hypothetical protein
MSYHYEDTSHYCYSAPAHYVDTSYDDHSSSTPIYHVKTPVYDTPPYPVYYEDPLPDPLYYDDNLSDPVYHVDIPLDPIYHVDTPTYDDEDRPEPPLSHGIVDELELKLYVEAASSRIYSYDEIHPAYRNTPSDITPPIELYYEPSPPPALELDADNRFSNSSDDDLVMHAQSYGRLLGDLIERGYSSTTRCDGSWNADNFKRYTREVHLIETVQRQRVEYQHELEAYIEAMSNRVATVEEIHPIYHDNATWTSFPSSTPCTAFRIESEDDLDAYVDLKMKETYTLDEIHPIYRDCLTDTSTDVLYPPPPDLPAESQSTPPSHHQFYQEIVTTSPPDICTPIPLPPSPNIWYKPTHLTPTVLIAAAKRREPRYHLGPHVRRRRSLPKFRNNTSTTPPPDIRPPKPFPPSPNISVRQSKIHLPYNHHPPDICAPRPLPQKPNISTRTPIFQQSRRPPRLRPRRKHPPHSMNQVHSLTPHHSHNVIRRISKKSRPHLFQMFEGEHHLEGTRCVMAPFPLSLFHSLISIPFSSLAYTPSF